MAVLLITTIPSLADQQEVFKTVLDNGLTVLIQEVPTSQTVSIDACVKTGSAMEGRYLGMGVSHFVEHMLFKGTVRRPVGSIAKEVKKLGGNINASTSHDDTIYTLDLPQDSLAQGLDIMSDMVMNSIFDAQEMEKERKVIHGEMRLYNDRPDRVLSDLVFRNVYIQNPYRHPIIGYPPLFDSITRDELFGYYKERYAPNNMVLSVAGPFPKDKILPLIDQAFKDFKPRPFVERNLPQEPPQMFKRYLESYYPTPFIHFFLAYQGVSVLEPDLYAMDVLSMALGEGQSSRLYREVYQNKHLVESISSSNFTPQDRGLFEIQGMMSKDNLEGVLAFVKVMVGDIQKYGLSSAELEKTKRQVLSQFVFENQTSSSLASRAAMDEAMTGDANFSRHYVKFIKKVRNEDIQRVANRYLQDSHLSITVLKPKSMAPANLPSVQVNPQSEIKKIVLDNGLTILVHEDHSVPVLAIKLLMHGGTRVESQNLGGISQFMGRVWIKGSQHLSEDQINQTIEQRGGTLRGACGFDTCGITFDVLSDDQDLALNMLADFVENPSMPSSAMGRQHQEMLTALQERQDDIMATSSRALLETLYLTHPIRRDPLGTKESLSKITRRDLLEFYQKGVYGNNMVIAVFGDCDANKVLQQLKQKFSFLKKGNISVPLFTESSPQTTRLKTLNMEKEQALVMMGFQAPSLKNSDRFGMEVIDTILGSGLSGRLFVKVRDQTGQAYTTGSRYSPDLDTGTFTLYVLTKSDKIDSVKSIVTKELENLRTQEAPAQELAGAKNYLKGLLRRFLTTNSALASMAATDELFGLGYDFYRQYDGKIDAVTAQDVRRIANKYLDIHKAAIIIVKSKEAGADHHE